MTLKPMLAALAGQTQTPPPFWLMRQAGRYLPEYRQVRAQAGGFLDLCLNPELACEVTLQPLRRYGMDAAILFSDILIIPWALGQGLRFAEGEGPVLDAIRDASGLAGLKPEGMHDRAAPIYETVSRIRAALDDRTTLIGFAGSPWTVACYMVEGGGSKEYAKVKRFAYTDPAGFDQLIDILVTATVDYLSAQVKAGAEVLQLFDSWAGALSAADFQRYSVEPTRRIVAALKALHPAVPIIGFPRMAGLNLVSYVEQTGVDAVSLDPSVPPEWAAAHLQGKVAVQGNLDPVVLLAGGEALEQAALSLLDQLGQGPFIFNLGHGIIKETPPEHVTRLAGLIRDWQPATKA
ncbi:uroporphyrinogen decarboxylase [Niveispirillum sp. BGYR6]|uniref:uroporphyrinogen decarboxylase n=1 Tax=Niveispirillum sp. BGYR6 TaxID=2971249 RepID=UPI0022B9BB26|nr:uroporphyrinogen decarboxylase [Niveispirillum sp. BGYR6]MDG5495820.1 uroporphyrinogen decarboxylase [Niveispirillum sp. BGYR6]